MGKGKNKPLPPELAAKYLEWLKNTPGGTPERYLLEGQLGPLPLSAEETESFRKWMRDVESGGGIEYEENEDMEGAAGA
jgi:hypothetical protein